MKKMIVIDAGHGLHTAGKRCLKSIDPIQTREWVLNSRIADRLQEILSDYDCTVFRADDNTGMRDISLPARVRIANVAKADVYLSIHHNAGINGGVGGGTVVFYYSENPDRRRQAQALYDSIISKTGLVGNRSSKVIKNGFYVVKNTKMPAFLIENGFMDSLTDTPIILSTAHAEQTAQGILAFLVEQFCIELKKDAGECAENISHGVYYPPYKGANTTLVFALKSLGIDFAYYFRKKIAAANGIDGYSGTAEQNTQMYELLKKGLLKRAE